MGYFNILAIEDNAVINRCVHIMHQNPVFKKKKILFSFPLGTPISILDPPQFIFHIAANVNIISFPGLNFLSFPLSSGQSSKALSRACETGESGPCPPPLPSLLSSLTPHLWESATMNLFQCSELAMQFPNGRLKPP